MRRADMPPARMTLRGQVLRLATAMVGLAGVPFAPARLHLVTDWSLPGTPMNSAAVVMALLTGWLLRHHRHILVPCGHSRRRRTSPLQGPVLVDCTAVLHVVLTAWAVTDPGQLHH